MHVVWLPAHRGDRVPGLAPARKPDDEARLVSYSGQVSWSSYGVFLAFASVLVLIPGPDFTVVAKNTLAAGRYRGRWAAVGVCTSNAVQGTAAAAGLGALIVRAQPIFETIKWAGVCAMADGGPRSRRGNHGHSTDTA
jgi:hypothetical protein